MTIMGTQDGYTSQGVFDNIPLIRCKGPRPKRSGSAYGEVWFEDELWAEIGFREGSPDAWAGPSGWIWLDGNGWEALLVAKRKPGILQDRWELSHAFMGGIQDKVERAGEGVR